MTTAHDLVLELGSAGDLPAGFGPLLEKVPRARFIPDRIWVNREPIDRVVQPERWLRTVYTDESIVTQFDDGRTVWPDVGRQPTCSASMPSVVVAMLDALQVRPGQRVLEVGTGTGYNAALLAELVGETGRVVTVEIDDGLARVAEQHLKEAGYEQVRVVVGDGEHGVEDGAPYDRAMATMSVHLGRIPYAWVAQTKPGGIVVTPVRARSGVGTARGFHRARGRYGDRENAADGRRLHGVPVPADTGGAERRR